MQAYLTEIEQIIDRSRREEEAFLVDKQDSSRKDSRIIDKGRV